MEKITPTAAQYHFLSADPSHAAILAWLGRETFLSAFGHVFDPHTLQQYIERVYNQPKLERDLQDAANHFLLMHDGLAGYAGYAKLRLESAHGVPGRRPVQLEKIYLLDAFHGQGAGRELLDAALEQARAWGGDRVWLEVWKENHKAQAFYRRNLFYHHADTEWQVGPHTFGFDVLVREV